jgi:ABC-type Fe3+-hydroxamate transport system substrate-binding protein
LALVGGLVESPAQPSPAGGAGDARRADEARRDEARRIVSLIPAATEILFAIGAGDRLVGRTRWGVYPAPARAVPDVGDGVRPALELVVAQQPDLVILYAGAENAGVAERLGDLGISTLSLHHDTLADLDRNILALGEATGCSTSARRLQSHIREALSRVTASVRSRDRARVYYDVWADPPITIGRGSYLDVLIQTAGGLNVFGDLVDPSPQVSLEAIVARGPDVILHPVSRHEQRSAPEERPGWTIVPAVGSGRVHRIDGDLAHRLGPRVAEAALQIARVLHPDASDLRDLPVDTPEQGPCLR